jgi:hypothetical protein
MKRAYLLAALVAACCAPAGMASAATFDRDVPTQGAAVLRLNVSGSVRIVPTSGLGSIQLHVTDYGKTPPFNVTTAKIGSRLTITVSGPSKSILPFVGATGYELQVNVPENMKLDVREFSGQLHVERVTAPMQLYDADGSIIVDDAGSALTAQSDSGDVTVANARGMLELTCAAGNATATLSKNWNGNLVRMESAKGDLTLNVPSSFRARFDVTTGDGKVTNPLRNTPHAPLVFMLAEQGNVSVVVAPKS